MPKIFLLGGAGIPNYGDELIAEGWLKWYVQEMGVSPDQITLSGSSAPVLSSLFEPSYKGCSFDDSLKRLRFEIMPCTFFEAVRIGYEYPSKHSNHAISALKNALDADILHLHGGGYLNEKWPSHGLLLGLLAGVSRITGARLIGTGLGIGPLAKPSETDSTIMSEVLSQFDAIEVRDSASMALFGAHDDSITQGTDDSFLHKITCERNSGSALHISSFRGRTGDLICQRLDPSLAAKFDRLIFWSCLSTDALLYVKIAERFPKAEIYDTGRLLEAVPLHDADFMITERFHPHLVGARLGMRGIYRSSTNYYDVKHGSVVQLGSPFTQERMSRIDLDVALAKRNSLTELDYQLVGEKRHRVLSALDGAI